MKSRSWAECAWCSFEKPQKPVAGEPGYFFECAGLFEEVRRARNDLHLALADHLIVSLAIHADDRPVVAADDQQRRRCDVRKRFAREVRPSTARDDAEDSFGQTCSGDERRGAAGTRA